MAKLKDLSVKLTQEQVDGLDKLAEAGAISSRSEGIRTAVRDFLHKEFAARGLAEG